MIYFINNNTNPYFNLALEEALIKQDNFNEDILLLWQNYNTIVIGKNQNTIEEVNQAKVEQDNVMVVRRLSGGGAVFHDQGNLNFTFITKKKNNLYNFETFVQPIINALKKLGLNAQFTGKNDIQIDGKKISGNAQYFHNDKVLHHGTVLFNVDLTKLGQYLNVDPIKMVSKGIKSIKAQVTNILPLLAESITIEQLKDLILQEFKSQTLEIKHLDDNIISQVNQLLEQKYSLWEWNYGKSPEFEIQNKAYFPDKGKIDVRFTVESGKIKDIKFYGDFLGSKGLESIENVLKDCWYKKSAIKSIVENCDIKSIFGEKFTIEEILELIIN